MNDATKPGVNWLNVSVFVAVTLIGLTLVLFASGTGTGFVYGDV